MSNPTANQRIACEVPMLGLTPRMNRKDAARRLLLKEQALGITDRSVPYSVERIRQIENAAFSKIAVLLMEEEFESLSEQQLRSLAAMCRNALISHHCPDYPDRIIQQCGTSDPQPKPSQSSASVRYGSTRAA